MASKRTFSEMQESEDGAESDSSSYDGDDSSVSDDVLDSSSSSSQDSDTSHSSADSLLQSSGSADTLTYDLDEDISALYERHSSDAAIPSAVTATWNTRPNRISITQLFSELPT